LRPQIVYASMHWTLICTEFRYDMTDNNLQRLFRFILFLITLNINYYYILLLICILSLILNYSVLETHEIVSIEFATINTLTVRSVISHQVHLENLKFTITIVWLRKCLIIVIPLIVASKVTSFEDSSTLNFSYYT
jgi:hypothetical protein